MKFIWNYIGPGRTDFLGMNGKSVCLVDLNQQVKFSRSFPFKINCFAYSDVASCAVFSDLDGNLECVSIAENKTLWRKHIKSPVGGLSMWENVGAVCVSTPVPAIIDLRSGIMLPEPTPTLRVANCSGGILVMAGSETTYINHLSCDRVRLEGDPIFRYALEFSAELIMVENIKKSECVLQIYNRLNGNLINDVTLEKGVSVRAFSYNPYRETIIIGGVFDDLTAGFWEYSNNRSIFLGRNNEIGLGTLGTNGDFAMFRSGHVYPVFP